MKRAASLNTRRAAIRWHAIPYLCAPCGSKYGKATPGKGATWHVGYCNLCRSHGVAVCARRNFNIQKTP